MKSQSFLLFFIVFSVVLFTTTVLAEPNWTFIYDQSSVRPGMSGTISISIQNTDPVNEKSFVFCIKSTSAGITGICDSSITYLNTGQSGTAKLSYSVSNDVPTPSSQPVSITIDYDYAVMTGWLHASYTKSSNIAIAGISIKDEANQKITQVGTAVSSAQNTITNAQTTITTAQNMITTVQQQNKDVSSANSYISTAQSSLSSAQSYFSNAQNEYSQAQSLYTSTSYQDSLNTINQASSDASNAASYASSASQVALQAQTAVTNAGCVAGYVLQSGQCIQNSNPNNPANPNQPSNPNYSPLWIIIVIIVLVFGVWYYYSKKKVSTKK